MPFKLLDFNGCEIKFSDLENKQFWCSYGESQEKAFITALNKLKNKQYISDDIEVEIHPDKSVNKYSPDLLINKNITGELKTKNSPLFQAMIRYGIDPQFALTMDLKDSFNYQKFLENGIDITIFIWVKWEAHKMITWYNSNNTSPTNEYSVNLLAGIWKTKFSTLRRFEKESPPPIHWYKNNDRQPTTYTLDNSSDEYWINQLLNFEERLESNSIVKNITSNGYLKCHDGITRPSGNSSASYVFDLSNENLFEEVWSNHRPNAK